MKDEDPFEEALKAIRPAELPSHLMARLTAGRPQGPEKAGQPGWSAALHRWLPPLATGACVAVATFFWLEGNHFSVGTHRPVATVGPGAEVTPVESGDYLVDARPVGTVVAPDQRAYRLMEVEWIEYETVRKGADGPDLHTATTRRDIIPVALDVY